MPVSRSESFPSAMWNMASNAISTTIGLKPNSSKPTRTNSNSNSDSSDDEVSSNASREEGLECPICWESFNIVENVPYVLWCGHTLCKNCVLGLQWAVVKFPALPVQLPLFISCPWCHLLSFRLVYKGNLKFPRKNFFLLWMVESMNGDRVKSHSHSHSHSHSSFFLESENNLSSTPPCQVNMRRVPRGQVIENMGPRRGSNLNLENFNASLRKSLVFFVHLTAKFPLVIIFLLIVLYAIPASAVILAVYVVITVLFALPSFLVLYFAYPSLDWLVREIIT